MSVRAWWLGLVGVTAAVLLWPGVAGADERTAAIAGELSRTGIYVTDHAPRAIGPEDIPRLRRMLDRIPVRTFLAVTPRVGVSGEPLAAVLHDRLGQDGSPAPARDRIDRVVAGLEQSPLFVDPDVGHLVPPARAIKARRAPEVLTDRSDGHDIPYFEVDATRSVWAATAYGTLTDDLVPRILRGDFTRCTGR